jgi:hypothetical protein
MRTTKLNLRKVARAVEKAQRDFIQIAGKDAELHFERGFVNEGFTDETTKLWAPTKKPTGRKILTGKTRKLKKGFKRAYNASWTKCTVYNDVPYFDVHQEGEVIYRQPHARFVDRGDRGRLVGRGTFSIKTRKENMSREKFLSKEHVRGSSFKMPRRQMIGPASLLERRTLAKGGAMVYTAMKNASR